MALTPCESQFQTRQFKNEQAEDKICSDKHFTLEQISKYVRSDHTYALAPLNTSSYTPSKMGLCRSKFMKYEKKLRNVIERTISISGDDQLQAVFGNADPSLWNTSAAHVEFPPIEMEMEGECEQPLVPDEYIPDVSFQYTETSEEGNGLITSVEDRFEDGESKPILGDFGTKHRREKKLPVRSTRFQGLYNERRAYHKSNAQNRSDSSNNYTNRTMGANNVVSSAGRNMFYAKSKSSGGLIERQNASVFTVVHSVENSQQFTASRGIRVKVEDDQM